MQSRPTAHQHLQFWAGSQQLREERSNRGNLLKVIQQQQEVLLSKEAFELLSGCARDFCTDLCSTRKQGVVGAKAVAMDGLEQDGDPWQKKPLA